ASSHPTKPYPAPAGIARTGHRAPRTRRSDVLPRSASNTVVPLGCQHNEVSSACCLHCENLLDNIPLPHHPVPGPPLVARFVHCGHIPSSPNVDKREGALVAAKNPCEP